MLEERLAPDPVPVDLLAACRRAYPLASAPDATLLARLFSLGVEIQSELYDARTA